MYGYIKIKQCRSMRKIYHLFSIIAIFLIFIATHQQSDSESQIDKETQYIQEFAKTMSDFIPTQTFTFKLDQGEQQDLLIWPSPEYSKLRGVFYIDNQEESEGVDGVGFFVGVQVNQVMSKSFLNQRLGVFNVELKNKPSNIRLIIKSDIKPLSVYVSYELQKESAIKKSQQNQNVPTQQQLQKSTLKTVSEKFQKVSITVQGQESALRMILKHIGKHSKRLQKELNYGHYRIILQTAIVILSGIFGMWILKKQMNNGYELLV